MAAKKAKRHRGGDNWTFFSNHAHVLLSIASDPELRLRDVANSVGITERAVQGIVADLVDAGYLTRLRSGRRNRYQVHTQHPLRHRLVAHHHVTALVALVTDPRRLEAKATDSKKRAAATRRKRSTSSTRSRSKD